MQRVDIMIPVWKPDHRLKKCVEALLKQTYPINSITLVLSEDEDSKDWIEQVERWFAATPQITMKKIEKTTFNHGGTRHQWAKEAEGDILLFMVQDAVPADEKMLEYMVDALKNEKLAVVYARHIPRRESSAIESYTRWFTYPSRDCLKTWDTLIKTGMKGCFTSNVCAAYSNAWYKKVGGFSEHILLSEDSVYAAGALKKGGEVLYLAKSRIIHSHQFSYKTQWKRNFDIGVVHKKYEGVFGKDASEKEGLRLIAGTAGYLIKKKKYGLLPQLFLLSAIKATAYEFGKHYQFLPKRLIQKCTLNTSYWEEKK